MSEPRISTSAVEHRACRTCSKIVEHKDHVGAYVDGPRWSPSRHDAPCGAPCLGGGVSAAQYRAGVHGSQFKACPNCKEST